MPRAVAVANYKGGVGKTTAAVNLAAILAEQGASCLLVDLDPQGAASLALGVEKDGHALLDALSSRDPLAPQPTVVPALRLVQGGPGLAGAERELANRIGAENRLKLCLERTPGDWDWVFFDCPAGTGILTVNGLVAADGVLLPTDAHPLALQALTDFLATLTEINQSDLHEGLEVAGVLPSRCHPRRLAHRRGVEALNQDFPGRVGPVIRENVALVEAPLSGKPVNLYAPRSNGAADYAAAALWLREVFGS